MKLAERVKRIKPSPTIEIDSKVKQMKADGIDVIGFGAGEPDFDTPDFIKEAAITALRQGKTKYTPVGGINELKDAIREKLKRDNDLSYSREEILVSAGAKHSLYNACQALLEAGDEVIIPAPYWVSYPDQVLLNDAKPIIVPTREENGFRLTPQELEKAITKKTKVFILNSPSNPTGSAYSRKELEGLAELLVQKNILCFADEIYEKVVYDGFHQASIASFNPQIRELTLTFNGASKAYSMTGWRMGYAAGTKELVQAMTKIQGQVTSNINTPTQWASVEALNGSQDFLKGWLIEFKKRRDFIVKAFNSIPGVTCTNPQGAFYVFPNVSAMFGKKYSGKTIKGSDDLATYLLEKALVAIVPGSGFGADRHIRLSYATSMENICKGMERITKAFKELSY
ncbi:MAG: pyridoxal phosphate-dependent aminotransferase [Deltaproteobacteria bacterium]|nr:pyridoxal phosphate-dependent aminotransferase [Deltaproteobacteria bacterium]